LIPCLAFNSNALLAVALLPGSEMEMMRTLRSFVAAVFCILARYWRAPDRAFFNTSATRYDRDQSEPDAPENSTH